MLYSFFQLKNGLMKRSPLKREKAAKYLSGLFRGIDNFDVGVEEGCDLDRFYGLHEQYISR